MTLEAKMSAARQAGRQAALARAPWDSNPHPGTGGSAVERVLSIAWRKGYSSVTTRREGATPSR